MIYREIVQDFRSMRFYENATLDEHLRSCIMDFCTNVEKFYKESDSEDVKNKMSFDHAYAYFNQETGNDISYNSSALIFECRLKRVKIRSLLYQAYSDLCRNTRDLRNTSPGEYMREQLAHFGGKIPQIVFKVISINGELFRFYVLESLFQKEWDDIVDLNTCLTEKVAEQV